METQLTYNNKSRHLGIRFRERYTTREGLQAKVREEEERSSWKERELIERPLFSKKKKKRRSAYFFVLLLHHQPSHHSPPHTPSGRRRARHCHGRPRVLRARREDRGTAHPGRQCALEAEASVARQAPGRRGRLLLLAAGRASRSCLGGGFPPARGRGVGRGQGGPGAGHEDAGHDGGRADLPLQKPL